MAELSQAKAGSPYRVSPAEEGTRLDKWFSHHFPELGRGRIQKMIRQGSVRIDGKRASSATRLRSGNVLRVPPLVSASGEVLGRKLDEKASEERAAAAFSKLVIHKDPAFAVINKPYGMAVQGGSGVGSHLDGLLAAMGGGVLRHRLVHRLDKHASGALIIAGSAPMAAAFAEQFREKRVKKIYWGLVCGVPRQRHGAIEMEGERTLYRAAAWSGGAALLQLNPISGKKHQLRRHCQRLGAPLHGDAKYAMRSQMLTGIAPKLHLHAVSVEFRHPLSGDKVLCLAPPPPHFGESLRLLGLTDCPWWWQRLLQ